MATRKPLVLKTGRVSEIPTGDVFSGAFLTDATVTYAKIQDVAGLSVVGRAANTSGVSAAITGTDGQVLRVSGTTLGFGTIATAGIADTAVTYAKIQNVAGLSVVGRAANTSGVGADITGANGNVLRVSGTALGFGTIATAGIANAAVTYAKLQNVSATSRFLGRYSASAGVVEEITPAQAHTMLGGPFTCGRLAYSTATLLTFTPYNGDLIKINGVGYQIPAGSITGLANTSVYVNGTAAQNLAASTLYYVYAFNNSGTVTADFSTTGYVISSTAGNIGTAIKSGDDTRSLIGLIRTNGLSQFADAAAQRFVASWFNRRNRSLTQSDTAGATTSSSGSFVELATATRAECVLWSDEDAFIYVMGSSSNNTASQTTYCNIGDTSAVPLAVSGSWTNTLTNQGEGMATGLALSPSIGYHYFTPLGLVLGGTGNYYIRIIAVIRI